MMIFMNESALENQSNQEIVAQPASTSEQSDYQPSPVSQSPTETEVYLQADKQRQAAGEQLEQEAVQDHLTETAIEARRATISATFMTDLARPLVPADQELSYDNVKKSLPGGAEIPAPIQQAKDDLVQEAMTQLDTQGVFRDGSLTPEGEAVLAPLLQQWGLEQLPPQMNQQEVQQLIELHLPFALVVAKFSSESAADRHDGEDDSEISQAESSEQATPSNPEDATSVNEAATGVSSNKATVDTRAEEKTESKRAAIWRETKQYIVQNAQNTDMSEFMRLLFGLELTGGRGYYGRKSEAAEALANGTQIGAADIKEASEDGAEKQLKKLIISLQDKLPSAVANEAFPKSKSEIEEMSDGDFRQFVQENQLHTKLESLFDTSQTAESAFLGLKEWLVTSSAANSDKKEKWKTNLESQGFTKTAYEVLLKYFERLKA